MLVKSYKHITCSTCLAKSNSLIDKLNDSELTELEQNRGCYHYKKQDTLFVEGSYPRGVFCLNQGKVKVFARGDEGKEQIIHIAKSGEIIGFRAMLSGDPYRVSAETLEECAVCFITKDEFFKMIDSNTEFRNEIIRGLSKELGERAVSITDMAQKSVRERIAASLLQLKDIYGEDPINLSREDLANYVGTATETLIRFLKDFKEDGLIDIQTRKVFILNSAKLHQISGR
ncbi:MAG: Crp/Fnr family transcriptional regulator [Bacteroidota bacterium]